MIPTFATRVALHHCTWLCVGSLWRWLGCYWKPGPNPISRTRGERRHCTWWKRSLQSSACCWKPVPTPTFRTRVASRRCTWPCPRTLWTQLKRCWELEPNPTFRIRVAPRRCTWRKWGLQSSGCCWTPVPIPVSCTETVARCCVGLCPKEPWRRSEHCSSPELIPTSRTRMEGHCYI